MGQALPHGHTIRHLQQAVSPIIERLENRELLSAATFDAATGILTITGTDAADNVTVKVAVPAASSTVTLSIERLGVASSSVLDAVPAAEGLALTPAVRVAVSGKVSAASSNAAAATGVLTSTLVAPATIVAVAPAFQLVPPSVEISSPAP